MLPPTARELTADDLELVEQARAVIDANTDGDDGAHTVGAAVRDGQGRVFVGVNVYHFTGGPCAELVALGAARAGGGRQLQTIVAIGNHGRGLLSPCGRDRQVLFDYHRDIRVIVPTEEGPRTVSVVDLMPLAFNWNPEPESQPPQG